MKMIIEARQRDELEAMPAPSPEDDELEHIFKKTLPQRLKHLGVQHGLDERTKRLVENTYFFELLLLAIGTLIWGFGDLVSASLNS